MLAMKKEEDSCVNEEEGSSCVNVVEMLTMKKEEGSCVNEEQMLAMKMKKVAV